MEGLRGFAVLLVFFVHYTSLVAVYLPAHSLTSDLAATLKTVGNSGVDLFFVLSGYLIYGKLISRRQPFVTFMRRRVERIYPTFIAVFAIYILFSALRPSENKIPHSLGGGLGYLVANFFLLPGLFPIGAMITQAWSLSYEIFFYLAIPLVVLLTGMRAWRPRSRIAFFALLAVGFAVYSAVAGGHVRLIMFISGILLFEVVRHRLFDAPPAILAPLSVVAGLALLAAPLNGSVGYSLKIGGLFAGFFVLCHVCFVRRSAIVTRLFSLTPMRWFGNMSYSYYLVHGLAVRAFFIALAILLPTSVHNSALFWLLLPVAFVVSVVPSAGIFLAVERPFSLSPALQSREAGEAGGGPPRPVPAPAGSTTAAPPDDAPVPLEAGHRPAP